MEESSESPETPPTLDLCEEGEGTVVNDGEDLEETGQESSSEDELPVLKAQKSGQSGIGAGGGGVRGPLGVRKRRLGMISTTTSNVQHGAAGGAKKKRQAGDDKDQEIRGDGGVVVLGGSSSPDMAALPPPQLHSVLDDEGSSSSVSSYENEELEESRTSQGSEDDIDDNGDGETEVRGEKKSRSSQDASQKSVFTETSSSSRGSRQVVNLPRGRAVFYTDKDGKAIVPPSRQTSPEKKSLEPRRIIQTLFAKPKPQKSKKRKGLSKKAKLALARNRKAGNNNSKLSSESSKFSKSVNQETSKDEKEVRQEFGETHCNRKMVKLQENRNNDESSEEESEKQREIESEVEKIRNTMLRKRRRLYEENTDGWKKLREEEENKYEDEDEESEQRQHQSGRRRDDVDSPEEDDHEGRSDDEHDDEEGMEYEGWKPMRAAMVAAMELVAKKQVTDDMRNERRIRKYLKPMPPKGKGRRSIFKRLAKPVKSPGDDNIPRIEHEVKSSNGTVFHSGDIVCLKPDLISGKVGDQLQLYQARGFVVSSKLGESVSILPLQRIVEVETSITHFIPRHYKLVFKDGPALVDIDDVVLVQRCPYDFYHGHDVMYEDALPGSTYCRVENADIADISLPLMDMCSD